MSLSPEVTAAVLLSAALHAGWNAMIKSSRDARFDAALVAGGSAVASLPLLPFVPFPEPASQLSLWLSVLLHIGYFAALAAAYRAGDLSHAYPIMRGVAPLLVAGAGVVVLGERLPATVWAGIALICGGILVIGLTVRSGNPHARRATLFALGNAAIIAAYTLVDGAGVRVAGGAARYTLWLFALTGIAYVAIIAAVYRGPFLVHARAHGWRGIAGGALTVAAYGIVLWAMTRAPVAAVAALRETSVIFGAALGAVLLKEGFGRRRILGAVAVAAGIVALRG